MSGGIPIVASGSLFILALLGVSLLAWWHPESRISVAVLIVLWVGVVFAGGLAFRGPLTITDSCSACKSKLKNIGTALEMYATDHGGQYPDSLELLTPVYLTQLPTCLPAALQQPVRGLYESIYDLEFGPYGYERTQEPDDYRLWCPSGAHTWASIQRGYPQYEGMTGLVERPPR